MNGMNEFRPVINEQYIRELLRDIVLPFGESNPIVMDYHNVFVKRYANSLLELTDLPRTGKVLELAASPYGMTAALVGDLFESVEIASFGTLGDLKTIYLTVRGHDLSLSEKQFNAEVDTWPYDDFEFDLVMSCEMIEHLAMDPMHVFSEANRVLKPGGRLFVSTPNASSVQNAVKNLAFRTPSMAPHYRSPATLGGIYERHNRELTPLALATMFKCGGFTEETYKTVDNYPFSDFGMNHQLVSVLKAVYGTDWRGDTLNFRGIKSGPVIERFPEEEELYIASDHPKTILIRNEFPDARS